MTLPYRYDLLMRVTIVGDGNHADGNGAMATARKIVATVEGAGIANVIDVSAFPANVTYLGKVDVEAPDPPRALGYLDNEAGTEAWRRGR